MDYSVTYGTRKGCVRVPSSKSIAHRLLICAALSHDKSTLICDGYSKDILATIKCLNALGAHINTEENGRVGIEPIFSCTRKFSETAHLYCGESGSTLRFLLPIVAALGVKAVFHMEGRLSVRPMDEYINCLEANGAVISICGDELMCEGRLKSGEYTIPGNISSQYISGLLFALPLLDGDSRIIVTGSIESEDYILMTEDAISKCLISYNKCRNEDIRIEAPQNDATVCEYSIAGKQQYSAPVSNRVEADWSNAAFFLCMGAMSEAGITVKGMNRNSMQGDRRIMDVIREYGAVIEHDKDSITVRRGRIIDSCDTTDSDGGHEIIIDATAIPDLVPVISTLAAGADAVTRIINAGRLRLKESDRIQTTVAMLRAVGACAQETENGIIIDGRMPETDVPTAVLPEGISALESNNICRLSGGVIDAANDHRIAMAAAVAAGLCRNNVRVKDAECVEKSFPTFWELLETLEVE